ncbi:MAG: hypothetical protein PHE89_04400 [Alphaproteobacteria bacterium]|nr:hypothetical protein [Alphaproteobacteria bacterium]
MKILVVGRLFQAEKAFLNSFKGFEFVFFDTYESFSYEKEAEISVYNEVNAVIIWDECQHLLFETIARDKPALYRNFRGTICEEKVKEYLSLAKEKNLNVQSFETVESDALYGYIETQLPMFEGNYGKVTKLTILIKAPFMPRVSNFVFEDEIGCVTEEYLRLISFFYATPYGYSGISGTHENHEYSKWGGPMFGNFRYLISADTDKTLLARNVTFQMDTAEAFVLSFTNDSQKLEVRKDGKIVHSRAVPLENYFEVNRPLFETFFQALQK